MFERLAIPADLLSDALMEARLSGVLTSRTSLQPPFALAFGEDVRRPGFHFALAGECWVIPRGKAPVRFSTGDIALLPHGAAHVLADDPTTPAISVESLAITLPPGGRAALPFGREGPATEVLCGAYDISAGAVPWLHGQPDLVHIGAAKIKASPLSALLRMLSAEAAAPGPGSALVQARLIDLVFVEALRIWLAGQQGEPDSWIGAVADPAIGTVLRAIHADPGHHWTLEKLADLAGQSRAVFARRFRLAAGAPPLGYVTKLRMADAAHLLVSGRRIADVAAQAGYQNEFAFAKAFKRVRGIAPGALRRRHAR